MVLRRGGKVQVDGAGDSRGDCHQCSPGRKLPVHLQATHHLASARYPCFLPSASTFDRSPKVLDAA